MALNKNNLHLKMFLLIFLFNLRNNAIIFLYIYATIINSLSLQREQNSTQKKKIGKIRVNHSDQC